MKPAGNYMFKVNNRKTRASCEICSESTIKTSATRHPCSSVSIVNFEQVNAGWGTAKFQILIHKMLISIYFLEKNHTKKISKICRKFGSITLGHTVK